MYGYPAFPRFRFGKTERRAGSLRGVLLLATFHHRKQVELIGLGHVFQRALLFKHVGRAVARVGAAALGNRSGMEKSGVKKL
jgi:hypothetical protein